MASIPKHTVMYSYPGDSSKLSALPILMLPLGFLLCLRLLPSVSVLSPLSLCVRLFSVGRVPQKYRSLSFVPATVKPLPQKIICAKNSGFSQGDMKSVTMNFYLWLYQENNVKGFFIGGGKPLCNIIPPLEMHPLIWIWDHSSNILPKWSFLLTPWQ